MNGESTENASQHEANKMVRVLSGKPLKLTVRVYLPDGRVVEWQADEPPKLEFKVECRALWLVGGEYPNAHPVMAWVEGSILLVEPNPV